VGRRLSCDRSQTFAFHSPRFFTFFVSNFPESLPRDSIIIARSAYYVRSGVLAGMFPSVLCLFVRNLRDFYRRDMPIRRMLLSTETLTKKTHRPISVLTSNPRKVGLAITASLELTQNRDLFLELFLDFLWKSSLQQATLENQFGIESLSCVIARWSRDNY